MMAGAAIENAAPRACALCAAPLGTGDGRRVCAGCGAAAERALRRVDPAFATALRQFYGLEDDGS